MRKGQVETMGLMIIVVLILFVGIFALKFLLVSPVNNMDEPVLSIKANNLMNALSKINICDKPFNDAVVGCCDGDCSCLFEEVDNIINNTLENNYKIEFCDSRSSGSCEVGISSTKYSFKQSGIEYGSKVYLCED